MTGFANFEFGIGAKWLEVLKEIAPATSRVALRLNPDMGPYYTGYMHSVQAVALSNTVQATLASRAHCRRDRPCHIMLL